MKCPRCQIDLRTTDLGEYGFIVLDVCPQCDGAWFDKGELDRLDESVWTDVERIGFEQAESHQHMNCPKCSGDLEPLSPKDAKELIVDRCPSCEGFWLDKGELDQIRDVASKADSKLLDNAKVVQRPLEWSWLRWATYCFKTCYSKRES